MRSAEITRFYMYGRWATARLLTAAELLEPPTLQRTIGGSFGSLQATIDHLYHAERMWADRWLGLPAAKTHSPTTPAEIRAAWEYVWKDQTAFIAGVSEAGLDAVFEYRNTSGNLTRIRTYDMLLHVANHGTYHRGQIADDIRRLGGTPVATDFLIFAKETA